MPIEKFRTERMVVRTWCEDDAEPGHLMYSNPEVMEFIGNGRVNQDLDEMRTYIAKLEEKFGPDHRFGSWPMVLHDTGEMVGVVLLKPLPGTDDIEVGWHMRREHWGNGYATEAARGAIRHGLEDLGLEVVYCVVDPANSRSLAVAKRLNLTPLGETEQYYDRKLLKFEVRR